MNKISKKGSSTDSMQYWNEKKSNINTFLQTAVSYNKAFVKNLIPFSTIYQDMPVFLPLAFVPFAIFSLQSSS